MEVPVITGYARMAIGMAYGIFAGWVTAVASDRWYSPSQVPPGWLVLITMMIAAAAVFVIWGAVEVTMAFPEGKQR